MENAHDFIVSAAEDARRNDKRFWKYSLLNLACGLELILKARLDREHWSLLFADVNKASKDKMKQGDFLSVDFETGLNRLKNISGVHLHFKTEKDLKTIRKIRNRIIHFTVDVDISELKGLVAKGINIFIEFYKENFEEDDSFIYDLSETLVEFEEFVISRLKSLEDELKASERPAGFIKECDRCLQNALILEDDIVKCLFCGNKISPRELAENLTECGVEICPECSEETFIFILYNNEEGDFICVSCGFKSNENYNCECERCGNMFWNENGQVVCEDCWSSVMDKE